MALPAPPSDPEYALRIEKLADYVARNGLQFENVMRQKQVGNPQFGFLDPTNPAHPYYRHCLNCLMNGGWSLEQLAQVRGSSSSSHSAKPPQPPGGALQGPSPTQQHQPQPQALLPPAGSPKGQSPPPLVALTREEEAGLGQVLANLNGSKEAVTAGRDWIAAACAGAPFKAGALLCGVRRRAQQLAAQGTMYHTHVLYLVYLTNDVVLRAGQPPSTGDADAVRSFAAAQLPAILRCARATCPGQAERDKVSKVAAMWVDKQLFPDPNTNALLVQAANQDHEPLPRAPSPPPLPVPGMGGMGGPMPPGGVPPGGRGPGGGPPQQHPQPPPGLPPPPFGGGLPPNGGGRGGHPMMHHPPPAPPGGAMAHLPPPPGGLPPHMGGGRHHGAAPLGPHMGQGGMPQPMVPLLQGPRPPLLGQAPPPMGSGIASQVSAALAYHHTPQHPHNPHQGMAPGGGGFGPVLPAGGGHGSHGPPPPPAGVATLFPISTGSVGGLMLRGAGMPPVMGLSAFKPPNVEDLPVGAMVGAVKVALGEGHAKYAPLDPHKLAALKPPAVEPGRLDARVTEYYRKMDEKKNSARKPPPPPPPPSGGGRYDDYQRQDRDHRGGRASGRRRSRSRSPEERWPRGASLDGPGRAAPVAAPVAATKATGLAADNEGYRMLKTMGWAEGSGLGAAGREGIAAPIDDGGQTAGDKGGIGSKQGGQAGLDDFFASYRTQRSGDYHARIPNRP